MICGSCQRDIADNSNFCYFCGARQQAAAPAGVTSDAPETGARKLRRSIDDRVLGGVCGGFGEYFDVDPVLIRVVWGILAVTGGVGILAYIICWIVIDEASSGVRVQTAAPVVSPLPRSKRLRRSATDVKWAGVCGGIAEHLGVDSTLVRVMWVILTVVPGAILGGLIVYLVAWMVLPAPDSSASPSSNQPVAHSS